MYREKLLALIPCSMAILLSACIEFDSAKVIFLSENEESYGRRYVFTDVDGDGRKDLITGASYFAPRVIYQERNGNFSSDSVELEHTGAGVIDIALANDTFVGDNTIVSANLSSYTPAGDIELHFNRYRTPNAEGLSIHSSLTIPWPHQDIVWSGKIIPGFLNEDSSVDYLLVTYGPGFGAGRQLVITEILTADGIVAPSLFVARTSVISDPPYDLLDVKAQDINGDSKLDLVLLTRSTSSGPEQWSPITRIHLFSSAPYRFLGESTPKVITHNSYFASLQLLGANILLSGSGIEQLNNPLGASPTWTNILPASSETDTGTVFNYVPWVDVADLDNDGDLDLAAILSSEDDIGLHSFERKSSSYSSPRRHSSGVDYLNSVGHAGVESASLTDVDSDGKPDFAFALASMTGQPPFGIGWQRNKTDGGDIQM